MCSHPLGRTFRFVSPAGFPRERQGTTVTLKRRRNRENEETMFLDATYFILIPGLLIALLAQMAVKSAYRKFSDVPSRKGYSGADVARRILDDSGLYDVRIEVVGGALSDHYDPRSRVLALSRDVYEGTSLASLGVASHEVGHAIQHYEGYAPLKIRSAIVPVANFGSTAAWPIFIIGLLLQSEALLYIGIGVFLAAVLFQLVTLPVELNASRRAQGLLSEGGYLEQDEMGGAKKVLRAAAWTYVAAALMSILQLARLLLLAGGRSRRRN